jgi:DNA-binding transcriptional regulator GbsR (MarR family)
MADRAIKSSPASGATITQRVDDAQDRFIASWGQMASAWGISRTMAEVHALLYITGRALNTDDVIERLQISRGNASMSLRSLQDWGLIARVHRRGDRKEYFEAESDVWAIFKTIARERKKRELDPVLTSLYEVRDLTELKPDTDARHAPAAPHTSGDNGEDPPQTPAQRLASHNQRLDAMLEFMSTMEKMAQMVTTQEGAGLRIVKMMMEKLL